MIELILIGFMLGFITGLSNDKARQRGFNIPLTFWEFIIPTVSIIFVIYSFTYGIWFGFLAIIEIMVGAFIGKKTMDWVRKIKYERKELKEVDKAAEDAVIDALKYVFPDHSILGEENGEIEKNKNANILQSESSIEKKIKSVYLLGENLHGTNINWEDFERFAQEHGGRTDKYADGGQDTAFSITIDGIELKVIAIRDRLNGTTRITAESYEVFKRRAMARSIQSFPED